MTGKLEAFKKPFRAGAKAVVWLITLPREHMRNLFSLFMLLGIVVLTLTNNFFLFIAKGAIGRHEDVWYGILFEQLRFNNYLIAWFAGIVGLLVFGADYIRGKIAGYELGFGKGGEPVTTSETKRIETIDVMPPTPPPVVSRQDMEAARKAMSEEQGKE